MHTETNATSVFILLVATFLERFLFLVNSNNRKHQERYKKWLLCVPRLHLLLSTNPRKVLNFGHFKKTTEICESLLKQLTACESANPESIPRALFGTMLIKHSIMSGCIWKSVQKSPGCHWGDSTQWEGDSYVSLGRTSPWLACSRWLSGQWVFQSVNLAKHLTVTPVWAGITSSLFLPVAEGLWQHQGSQTL